MSTDLAATAEREARAGHNSDGNVTVASIALIAIAVLLSTPANAVTFDVSGSNAFGDSLTGTLNGDAALTTVTFINLTLDPSTVRSLAVPFVVSYTSPKLVAQSEFIFTQNPFGETGTALLLTIWLSYPGGPTQAANTQAIDSIFQGEIAQANASNNPDSCGPANGGALIDACRASVDIELQKEINQINSDYALNFSAVAVPQVAETPLPAAFPLFASGLGALGLLGWRRKRKTAALWQRNPNT